MPDEPDPLQSLIADILDAEFRGEPVDRDAFVNQHPEHANLLREFFANHDSMKAGSHTKEVTLPPASSSAVEDATLPPSTNRMDDATLPPRDEDATLPPGAAPSHSSASVGDKVRYFGDYQLLEEIARGGMGVVYKARQVNLNRIVALKMILAGQLAGEEDVKRFYTEAEAAASLDHPGIVPIFEVGERQGQHYFSMGYVEGQSLAQRVADGPLPPREAAELVKKICEAMAYAHSRGVVHRDLKPANILLDQSGQPKVTDFGLAKQMHVDSGLTGTGQILGTPSYMAPEQASAKGNEIGPLADVYSLGAVLYCLLVGRPPFQAATPLETVLQVIDNEPLPPRALNPRIAVDLDTICIKCLNKESKKRYEGAQELQADLRRFLAGEPIAARRVGKIARGMRWCGRNRLTAGLIAATSLSLIVGTCVSLFLAYLATNEARRADENAGNAMAQAHLAEVRLDEAVLARNQAERSQRYADAERLTVLSQKSLRENRPQQAMLLATEALATTTSHNEPEALSVRQNLQDVLRSVSGVALAPRESFEAIQISPQNRWLAMVSSQGSLRLYPSEALYRTPSTPVSLEPPCEKVTTVAVGDQLMAVATDHGEVHVYQYDNKSSAKRVATFRTGVHSIDRLILGNSQKYLLASTAGHQTLCWRLDDQKQVFQRSLRLDFARFSPDDRWLLIASNNPDRYEYVALLLDMSRIEEDQAYQLDANTNALHEAVFSADGQVLIASNGDGKLRLWDLNTGSPVLAPTTMNEDPGQSQYCLLISSDNRWLSSVNSNGKVRLWNLQETIKMMRSQEDNDAAKPVSVSLEVSCEIRLKDYFMLGATTYQPIAFSPDAKWLAVGGNDGSLHVWELNSIDVELGMPTSKQTISGHQSAVTAIQWALNNRRFVTGSADNTLRIWEQSYPSDSWLSTVLRSHESIVDKICIADGSGAIITHAQAGDVRNWGAGPLDSATSKLLMLGDSRACAHLPSRSSELITRSGDWITTIYQLNSDLVPRASKVFVGHELGNDRSLVDLRNVMARRPPGGSSIPNAAPQLFSKSTDGRWLATSAGCEAVMAKELYGKVRVWDMQLDDPGTKAELYAPFKTPVTALALSLSGRWLAAGSDGGKIMLYDRTDPSRPVARELKLPRSGARIVRLAITDSVPWLICQSENGPAGLWRLEPGVDAGLETYNVSLESGHYVVGTTENWLIALYDKQRKVGFLDLKMPNPLESMRKYELPWAGEQTKGATLSDDNRWLVVFDRQATQGSNVCVFDLSTEQPIESRREFVVPGVQGVYLSEDSRWIIATTAGSLVMLSMQQVSTPDQHPVVIELVAPAVATDVAFHVPTQRLAATFAGERTHLWELLKTDRGPLLLGEPADKINFVGDGSSLLNFENFLEDLRAIRVDYLDSKYMTSIAASLANRDLTAVERAQFRLPANEQAAK